MNIRYSEIPDWTKKKYYTYMGWAYRVHVVQTSDWTDLHPNVGTHPWARLGGQFKTADESRISPSPQLDEWCARHNTQVYVRISGDGITFSFPSKAAAIAFRLCL